MLIKVTTANNDEFASTSFIIMDYDYACNGCHDFDNGKC